MKRARAKKVKSLDEQIQLKEAHLASSFNSMNEANKILNITKPPPLAAMLTKSYISTVQEVDEAKIPTPTSNFCGPVLVTKTYAKKFPDPPPTQIPLFQPTSTRTLVSKKGCMCPLIQ